jgi:NADH pyrophosphatase NudC (nudix superfamily)
VAGLVRLADAYVLARNANWPTNIFSLVTGYLESGESPESAAMRETEEELGVRTQAARLIGHFPLPQLNELVIAYELRATGDLLLGDEIIEVKLVSRADLASFDFGPLTLTREIISSWLQDEASW